MDLAIYDNGMEQFILGIECDGAMYHSSEDAIEHDFYRRQYIESGEWKIHKIWSTNWCEDSEIEVDKILRLMNLKKSYL